MSVMSHPTWVRGLKQAAIVSPEEATQSHPTWVRGLKLRRSGYQLPRTTSHPTWVRGLKPLFINLFLDLLVAPYVGAWIETPHPAPQLLSTYQHPTWVRGLKLVLLVSWLP